MPKDPITGRGLAWAISSIALVWAALFAPQLAGRVFVLGDAASFRPFAEFSRERWLATHERTFWNPYVFAGIPATASLADTRPQYLPDAALDGIEWLHRSAWWPPLAAPLAAHLAGMLAAGLLARALWSAGAAGVAWAGLAWGLMPNLLVPFAFGHDAQFVAASLLPAVLLAVHHVFAARDQRGITGAALSLALALGLQGLAGHPQIVVYTGAFAIAFALERAWRYARRGRLAVVAAAAVLGAGLSAAVWWPAFLYGAHSVRGGPWGGVSLEEVANFSQAFRDLLSLIWPWAVGFGGPTYWGGLRQTDYPQYIGITVALLAIWAWPRRADRRASAGPRPRAEAAAQAGTERDAGAAWLFIGAAAVSVLLSLGTNLGGLYRFVHEHVPLFSTFRVAVAALAVAQLSLALLSARGLERVLSAVDARRRPGRPALVLAAAGSLLVVIALAIAFGPLRDAYTSAALAARSAFAPEQAEAAARLAGRDLILRGVLVALLAGALVLHSRGGQLARLAWGAPLALGVLLICDLGSVSAPILRRATGREEQLEAPSPPALARVAAADPLTRALPLERRAFLSNQWVSWRARSIAGEHGAVSRYWSELFSGGFLRSHPALCAFSVRYIAGDSSVRVDTSLCDPVFEGGTRLPVLRLRGARPRAYAVPRVVAPGNDDAVIRAMLASDFDPASAAYASEREAAGDYPGSAECVVRWVEDSPDRLVLETEARAPAFMVVADAYFPGWRVRVDGREQTLFRVNQLARGVAVPAGKHRVTMEYRPEGWRAGMWSTRISAAVMLVLAVGLVGQNLRGWSARGKRFTAG